jgi:hypothetical protein
MASLAAVVEPATTASTAPSQPAPALFTVQEPDKGPVPAQEAVAGSAAAKTHGVCVSAAGMGAVYAHTLADVQSVPG